MTDKIPIETAIGITAAGKSWARQGLESALAAAHDPRRAGGRYPEPSTPYLTDEAELLHDVRDLLGTVVELLGAIAERVPR